MTGQWLENAGNLEGNAHRQTAMPNGAPAKQLTSADTQTDPMILAILYNT